MPMNFTTFWTGMTIGVAAFVGAALAYITRRRDIDEETALLHNRMTRDQRFINSGLYWKKWNGKTVPREALHTGASTVRGKSVDVYIGQAPLDIIEGAGVQVGAIHHNDEYVTITYDKIVHTNKKVKILCTRGNTFFQNNAWYGSETYNISPREDLAIVGHELDPETRERTPLYVGRGRHDGVFLVGKVYSTETGFKFCPYHDGRILNMITGFEVLGYIPH